MSRDCLGWGDYCPLSSPQHDGVNGPSLEGDDSWKAQQAEARADILVQKFNSARLSRKVSCSES